MEVFINIIVSFAVGVAVHYFCKWLDTTLRDRKE